MRIVFASDSFKGSMTSAEANAAMREGAERAFDWIEAVEIPISDGGEGLIDCLSDALCADIRTLSVAGPTDTRVTARYAVAGSTAVIEMAEASGITLVKGKKDALYATTYGTGELIRAAVKDGAKEIILGLGGSATTDGGMGALMALGAEFFDKDGGLIRRGCGAELANVASVRTDGLDFMKDVRITMLCDVDYTLLGDKGAAAVFAPQKGASTGEVRLLDAGLSSFADVLIRHAPDHRLVPGTGAAGGLGYGLMTLCGGIMKPGMRTVMELIGFKDKLRGAELVFTGEGRIDYQSAHGKAPGEIARAAAPGIPVIAIGGCLGTGAEELYSAGACIIESCVCAPVPLEDAMKNAKENLINAAYRAARSFGMLKKLR